MLERCLCPFCETPMEYFRLLSNSHTKNFSLIFGVKKFDLKVLASRFLRNIPLLTPYQDG
jgi:hypothetical protein